ncbi:MAG TPA: hypothetical protein VKT32_08050 [Chthonomonadaceae bacterium]|nr:hypothetical protein [Chthonomonadaceae bacterium]
MGWQETQGFAFLPAPDPLGAQTPTPLEARYNVLGIPLTVATNAPVLAELAEEVFGAWGAPPEGRETPYVRLQALLHPASESRAHGQRPTLRCRAQAGYLVLSLGDSLGFGDRPAGFAAAFITPDLLADPERVRTCLLECLGLFLVCRHRRATLHAAAVLHNDRCVLLTGEQGAGKSTLAYACLRAGFRLLAEDIVFAEREEQAVRAWGSPWHLHLLPDAVRFFPELRKAASVEQMNGERKLRVRVDQVRSEAPVTNGLVWGVCSLSRSADAITRLTAPDPTRIRQALTHFKEDPLLDRAAMHTAADRLLEGRLAHLEVGHDPTTAVETLRHWLETG